jgi:hypothetical protein
MKHVRFNHGRIGLVQGDEVYDVTEAATRVGRMQVRAVQGTGGSNVAIPRNM